MQGKTLCRAESASTAADQSGNGRCLCTAVYAGPVYKKDGGIPAFGEIKFSISNNRGCFGGCSFCALTFHQGRIVQVRSHESILEEARQMTQEEDFKGYIYDVGGPTANFRFPSCKKIGTLTIR